ncbi:hypothetical protein FOVG_19958 [Fusarium oxysporum f. sp. pisi HDV247]|uniref:Uncharacterized protein n=1 Tax=Fusarium oxysporum f. sp. pisi HDV247 TaxID=1080344 RepID=W9N6T6_FUSOX|nr:hypothetical protein FOVG_19958 [Fusarium oxysporum f. sp. pisi HDV247]
MMTVVPRSPILSPRNNLSRLNVSAKASPTLVATSLTLLVSPLSTSTRPASSSLLRR